MGAHRSLADLTELVTGRRFLVAGIALSVLFVAILATFFLPRKYESVARVRLLDNRALHAAYGRGGGGATDRAQIGAKFREDLAGRVAVLDVLKRIDMDGELRSLSADERTARNEELVRSIGEGTKVTEEPGDPGEFVFTIAWAGDDAKFAREVVTELVTGFQRRRFDDREKGAAEEHSKARDEFEKVTAQHEAAGKELDKFVEENREHRFGEEQDSAARLKKQRSELSGMDRQLETLRTRLADAREQLTEEPEFRDAEEGEESESGKVKNEVWVDLKKTEKALLSEIAVKARMRKTISDRVAALEERVQSYPILKRRYDELKSTKEALAARLDEARLVEEKAREKWQEASAEGALVYDVIDAPSMPGAPAGSQRLMVSFAGLLLGVFAGVAVVVLKGLTDQSFHRSDEVAGALDVPVLGAIARIETPVEREETRRKQRTAMLTVVVLAVLVGAAIVTQLLFDEPISSFVRDVVKLVK
jgi:capsular polysaccharide biosynthesis protein